MLSVLPFGLWYQTYSSKDTKSKMIFGWTTCLTYETKDKKLGYDYFSQLLDEMHVYGMTRLIVLMSSVGYFDPQNHGIAWPVTNEKLRFQLDKKAVNANKETEFFPKIIKKAHSLNIEVFAEIKYLGMIGIEKGYPGALCRDRYEQICYKARNESTDYERLAIESLYICPDNKQAHQYMRDKIEDVLTRYIELDGIVLEHPSYPTPICCKDSLAKIKRDTGKELEKLSAIEIQEWKATRVRDSLIDLKNLIKSINSKFKIGFYTGFSPSDGDIAKFQLDRGHDPKTLRQAGLDFLLPYCEGRHKDNEIEEIQKVIEYLAPMDIYLHTTIRREAPHNYPLPPKGPDYIKSIIKWGKEYSRMNRFRGMTFFNEVKIPNENRQAVYNSII